MNDFIRRSLGLGVKLHCTFSMNLYLSQDILLYTVGMITQRKASILNKLYLFTHSKTVGRFKEFATGWFTPRISLWYFPHALRSKPLTQERWVSPFSPRSLRCLRSNGLYSSDASFWTLHLFIHQTCYSKLVVFINNTRIIQNSSIQALHDLYSNT